MLDKYYFKTVRILTWLNIKETVYKNKFNMQKMVINYCKFQLNDTDELENLQIEKDTKKF